MNADIEDTGTTPSGGFEERLLSRILADYDELTSAPVPPRRFAFDFGRASRRARMGMAAPFLTAAVIVAVVIVSSHGSTGHTGAFPTIRARDMAYIIDRVRANLARLGVAGEGRVLERSTTRGAGSAGDPMVKNVDWAYIDPRTKVAYQRSVDISANGTVLSINKLVTTPVRNALHTRVTFLDPSRHAYQIVPNAPPSGTVTAATSDTELGIRSTAHQIDLALRSNRVAQRGTATVDGQAAIQLSVPPPDQLVKAGLPAQTTITLYVNARSYQPVEEVEVAPRQDGSAGGTSISRWLPTTPGTIALAKVRIPAGYRRMTGPVAAFWTNAKPLFFIGY